MLQRMKMPVRTTKLKLCISKHADHKVLLSFLRLVGRQGGTSCQGLHEIPTAGSDHRNNHPSLQSCSSNRTTLGNMS